jgi:hypothetical protein
VGKDRNGVPASWPGPCSGVGRLTGLNMCCIWAAQHEL